MLAKLALPVLLLIFCFRHSSALWLVALCRMRNLAPPPCRRPAALPPRSPLPPLLPPLPLRPIFPSLLLPPPLLFFQCGFSLLFPLFFLSFCGHSLR